MRHHVAEQLAKFWYISKNFCLLFIIVVKRINTQAITDFYEKFVFHKQNIHLHTQPDYLYYESTNIAFELLYAAL